MLVMFDAQHPYYLPQYLPVIAELQSRGVSCEVVIHGGEVSGRMAASECQRASVSYMHVEGEQEAVEIYRERAPGWIVFGNNFDLLDELPSDTRTALLYHGIGVKRSYYHANLMTMDVRFVEGSYRERELAKLYPDATLKTVGFAKLDPLFGGPGKAQLDFDLVENGLDREKPTILYAPTFYPSSIEKMPVRLPGELSECNLLLKPHQFTFTKRNYRHQLRKLEKWSEAGNTVLLKPEQLSLLPFMNVADLMISDASSALFEFAALDRPVVWCDFLKYRIGHRGIFRKRREQRMDAAMSTFSDIAAHARKPGELVDIIRQELADPEKYSEIRRRNSSELIGATDGKVSARIADYLLSIR